MRKQSLRNLAILCITIGGVLLGFCSVEDQFAGIVRLPHLLFTLLLVAATLLILVSVVIGACLLAPFVFSGRQVPSYEVEVAKRGDLEELHDFCERYVGAHFATLESWRKRHDKNPGTFFMLKEVRRKRFETKITLVGAFTIIPVNDTARRLLERDELSAVTFSSTHIAAPSERAAALYISGVIGSNFRSKGAVISFLKDRLKSEQERGNQLVYTRPMTADGLRLAKAYGFSPVNPAIMNDAERIYKKELSTNLPAPL